MGYSQERRESVLKKMLPPDNIPISALAKKEGISGPTLYNWRKEARAQGRLMPDLDNTPNGWTSQDRFAMVMETAAMNQAEIAAYCLEKGIYVEQLTQWRDACEQANDCADTLKCLHADNGSIQKSSTCVQYWNGWVWNLPTVGPCVLDRTPLALSSR